MVEGADGLSTLVGMRRNTDARNESHWIFFAIGSYLLWATLAIVYLLGWLQQAPSYNIPLSVFGTLHFSATIWLILLSLAISTGLSYLVYGLINRQNKHTAREEYLFREALGRAKSRTSKEQISVLLPLSSAEQDFYRLVERTNDRSAVLWALLVLTPYAGWIFLIIALYLVSQDLNSHEQTEQLLLQDVSRVLASGTYPQTYSNNVPPRPTNSLAYLFVSFASLGLLSLFWIHQVTLRQDNHFALHSSFEPGLLQALTESGMGTTGAF